MSRLGCQNATLPDIAVTLVRDAARKTSPSNSEIPPYGRSRAADANITIRRLLNRIIIVCDSILRQFNYCSKVQLYICPACWFQEKLASE